MLTEAQPIAGNQGTTITVSDLFYNVPTRLKGFNSGSDEYAQILKVIQRYAVELAGRVGITVKKAGIGSSADLQTSVSLSPSPLDVIRSAFGSPISKGLVSITERSHEKTGVSLTGCASLPTFHQKSLTLILFINGRLVESQTIKKTLAALYSQLLPKGTHPFIYLSLRMPPQNLDVNVHPTKSEVFFLHEETVLEFIDTTIRASIETSSMALECTPNVAAMTQTVLIESQSSQLSLSLEGAPPSAFPQTKKLYPFQLVHSDPKTRTLDTFFVKGPPRSSEPSASAESIPVDDIQGSAESARKPNNRLPSSLTAMDAGVFPGSRPPRETASVHLEETRPRKKPRSTDETENVSEKTEENNGDDEVEDPRELTSVKTLIENIIASRHDRLTEMIKNSVIVGLYSNEKMLIQYQSKLLMIEHLRFAVEMLYQKCLLGFGYHDCWKMPEAKSVSSLLRSHVFAYYSNRHSTEDVAQMVNMLSDQSKMLLEYFSLHIADDKLIALPRLSEGLESPSDSIIAELLYCLCTETNWEDEEECFHSIATSLSRTFGSIVMQQPRLEEYLRHYLYPALKGGDLSKFGHIVGYDRELVQSGAITELTSTHELYKIFERC